MRKTGFFLLAILSWTIGQLSAQPDPQDSVILESKIVAPVAGASGSGVVRMRVWITNKDSLTFVTLPLIETSVSGGAYMTLSGPLPRNFNRVVVPLTTTLQTQRIFNGARYNSSSPDSFLIAGGFDPLDPATIEPPNVSRKALWDIKFDTVISQAQVGFVQFDSGRVAQSLTFTNTLPSDHTPNFVKSIFQVGVAFQLDLIAPPDDAVVPEPRPTFLWHSLRDTTTVTATYTVFLADNPFFTPTDTSPPLIDTNWQVPTDLQVQSTYYWKVRAITPDNDTTFSLESRSLRVDAVPGAPLDISPPSGSDMSMFDYLVWLEGSDPDPEDQITYHLQIDDISNFSSPEVDQSGIDENTLAKSAAKAFPNALAIQLSHLADHDNLRDDSLYYWRVRSVDNHGGVSAYTSGQRNFFLNLADSSPRPVPGGFMPSGGVVLTSHKPDFSWFQSSDPDPGDPPSSLLYHLRLDTDGEIAGNFQFGYATPPGDTTFVPLDSLAENSHWYWAVRAVDSKGARSPFSAIQDFYINAVNEPPSAFSLLAPGDSSFTVTKSPTLDWADATDPDPFDAVSYEVLISPFANFDSAFVAGGLSTSSYTVQTGALAVRGRLYYWKVRAVDNASLNTESSEVFRFTLLKLGDANKDGQLTSADIVLLLNFIFLGEVIDPSELADLNCDGIYTGADIVLALNAVFLGQLPPCDP
jgi:hypothetical protein